MRQIGVRFKDDIMEELKLIASEVDGNITPSEVARAAMSMGLVSIRRINKENANKLRNGTYREFGATKHYIRDNQ